MAPEISDLRGHHRKRQLTMRFIMFLFYNLCFILGFLASASHGCFRIFGGNSGAEVDLKAIEEAKLEALVAMTNCSNGVIQLTANNRVNNSIHFEIERGETKRSVSCLWNITAREDERIFYTLENVRLKKSPECELNSMSIDNGRHNVYCNKSAPPKDVQMTTTSSLKIRINISDDARFILTYWAEKQIRGYLGFDCDNAGDGVEEDVCMAKGLEEAVHNMTVKARKGNSQNMLERMIQIADGMLAPEMKETWEGLQEYKRKNLFMKMTESIERSAVNIAANKAENQTLDFTIGKISVYVESIGSEDVVFYSDETHTDGPSVRLEVEDTQLCPNEVNVVIVIYHNVTDFGSLNITGNFLGGKDMIFKNSFLTVSLYKNGSNAKLSPHADDLISFTLPLPKGTRGWPAKRHCVFLNEAKGFWSDSGCRVSNATESYTTCSCDHLTFFAVLMDVSGWSEGVKYLQLEQEKQQIPNEMEQSLVILTYIGCGLSILCLAISIVVFCVFRKLWCQRTAVHCNLCITLLLGQVLFLAVVDRAQDRAICAVIAGFLHFLFLSAFAWMCLEGVQLYLLLVKVLRQKQQHIGMFYLSGYGIPIIIVALSAIINPDGYGTKRYCWLKHEKGFIWSFTGPVLFVMLINFWFLIKTMRVIYGVGQGKIRTSHPQTSMQCFRRAAKGAVFLQCILGLTWTIGYAYQGKETIIFAFIFTILNSTQGVFIFIFHVAANDQVLNAIQRKLKHLRNIFGSSATFDSGSSASSSSNQQNYVKQQSKLPAIINNKVTPVCRPGSIKLSVASLEKDGNSPKTKKRISFLDSPKFLEKRRLPKIAFEKRAGEDSFGSEDSKSGSVPPPPGKRGSNYTLVSYIEVNVGK